MTRRLTWEEIGQLPTELAVEAAAEAIEQGRQVEPDCVPVLAKLNGPMRERARKLLAEIAAKRRGESR